MEEIKYQDKIKSFVEENNYIFDEYNKIKN